MTSVHESAAVRDASAPPKVGRLVDQFEKGLDAPICLTWELTYACNLSCVHCLSSSGRRDPRELTTEQCKAIIDELQRMQVFYVNIGGGEPTVRSDFWELVDYATEHQVGVKFSTNGVKIDKKVAARLAASDYVDVQISLDGATAEVNDAVRGPGSFAMAVRALENLAEAGFRDAKISVVVTRHNVDQLDEFKALADRYGATLRITRLRPSGRAVDIMIPDYSSSEGRELGNRITNYLLTHREFFNIEYLIWRQQYIPATGQPNQREDRGDPTQNHFDHVHVTVAGGGKPTPNQRYGAAPTDGADDSSETTGAAGGDDCAPDFGHRSLNAGEIPAELRKWIDLGGQVCREVDSPLLAGLLYHESAGFQATAVSTAGAQGYGQFMPGTWAAKGAKVDDNGQIAGPPGSGSPSDPADATMAAARYLCEIAEGQREGIASGELSGDPQALMLAGYNAGPGAVQQFGGVPPYAETQKYVVIVPQEAARFAAA